MFEKYSEASLRALFYARTAVSEHGGSEILPEHLVLGVLTGAPESIDRFAATRRSAKSLRARLLEHVHSGEGPAPDVELPFADSTREVLLRAEVEAEVLQSLHVDPEHLLLGILVKTSGAAADTLQEAGVTTGPIRLFLQAQAEGSSGAPDK